MLNIDIEEGQVKSKVQGSRPKPYNITIALPTLTDKQWEKAVEAMARQAAFATKLLAGEMPQDIEDTFKSSEPAPTSESAPTLVDLLATFYQAGDELQRLTPHIAAPEIDSPLLRRPGAPPAGTFSDLETLYKAMTQRALSKVFSKE